MTDNENVLITQKGFEDLVSRLIANGYNISDLQISQRPSISDSLSLSQGEQLLDQKARYGSFFRQPPKIADIELKDMMGAYMSLLAFFLESEAKVRIVDANAKANSIDKNLNISLVTAENSLRGTNNTYIIIISQIALRTALLLLEIYLMQQAIAASLPTAGQSITAQQAANIAAEIAFFIALNILFAYVEMFDPIAALNDLLEELGVSSVARAIVSAVLLVAIIVVAAAAGGAGSSVANKIVNKMIQKAATVAAATSTIANLVAKITSKIVSGIVGQIARLVGRIANKVSTNAVSKAAIETAQKATQLAVQSVVTKLIQTIAIITLFQSTLSTIDLILEELGVSSNIKTIVKAAILVVIAVASFAVSRRSQAADKAVSQANQKSLKTRITEGLTKAKEAFNPHSIANSIEAAAKSATRTIKSIGKGKPRTVPINRTGAERKAITQKRQSAQANKNKSDKQIVQETNFQNQIVENLQTNLAFAQGLGDLGNQIISFVQNADKADRDLANATGEALNKLIAETQNEETKIGEEFGQIIAQIVRSITKAIQTRDQALNIAIKTLK